MQCISAWTLEDSLGLHGFGDQSWPGLQHAGQQTQQIQNSRVQQSPNGTLLAQQGACSKAGCLPVAWQAAEPQSWAAPVGRPAFSVHS